MLVKIFCKFKSFGMIFLEGFIGHGVIDEAVVGRDLVKE
jgi:hypothetical protein